MIHHCEKHSLKQNSVSLSRRYKSRDFFSLKLLFHREHPFVPHRECPSLPCFHMAHWFLYFPPREHPCPPPFHMQAAPVPPLFPQTAPVGAKELQLVLPISFFFFFTYLGLLKNKILLLTKLVLCFAKK